jgi:hypothetical protein
MKPSSSIVFLGTLCICIFFSASTHAQVWERTYQKSLYQNVFELKEAYDNGIIILGATTRGGLGMGWIIKTDVNGNMLWDKVIGSYGWDHWFVQGIDKTPDGGLIFVGSTDTLNPAFNMADPFIMKLNACGDPEWCRIYTPGDDMNDHGVKIIAMPDNTYTALFVLYMNGQENRSVWLYHLDNTGNILWEQSYQQNDPHVRADSYQQLFITPDNKYLITGSCYLQEAMYDTIFRDRPTLILADFSGESVWELPWHNTLGYSGEGYQSVYDGINIYSVVSEYDNVPLPDTLFTAPGLIKTKITGIPVSSKKLVNNFAYGEASTITKVSNDSLFIGTHFCSRNAHCTLSVLNVDTLGNIRKEKRLNYHSGYAEDALFTHDRKYLITTEVDSGIFYPIKLWKLNENLDFDSIYTRPMTYDSLCPHAILSGPIFPQCDIVEGIHKSAINTDRIKMFIYPNPGFETITIQIPECLQKQTETANFKVTTVIYKRTKELRLQVFDLFGKLIKDWKIKPDSQTVTMNVSSWNSGIYYFRLTYGNTEVAIEKFVKQ